MAGDVARWVAVAESPTSTPEATAAAVRELLAADPSRGASTVLGILALGPRYAPSRGLLIDPGDDVDRRWRRRVAAARELLASPAADLVRDEIDDELADSPELARAVAPSGTTTVVAGATRPSRRPDRHLSSEIVTYTNDSSPPDSFAANGSDGFADRLRAITARGSDARGAVTVELDGTGRLVDVAITSTAMDGNRGSLERAFRDAHDAAFDALEQARREQAPALNDAARSRVGDLVAEARSLQASAEQQLDRVVAAITAAAERASGGAG